MSGLISCQPRLKMLRFGSNFAAPGWCRAAARGLPLLHPTAFMPAWWAPDELPPSMPERSRSSTRTGDSARPSAPPAVTATALRSPPPPTHPPVVEASPPPSSPEPPSPPPLPLSCASDCDGRTCKEWLDFGGSVTCSQLQLLKNCDCSGCCLNDPPALPPPPPPPPPPPLPPPAPPPPPSLPPIPTSWPEECGNDCRGRTCRKWLEFGTVSCGELQDFGCPCQRCCIEDPPPPPAPPSPHYPPVDYGAAGRAAMRVAAISAAAGAIAVALGFVCWALMQWRRRRRTEAQPRWSLSPTHSVASQGSHKKLRERRPSFKRAPSFPRGERDRRSSGLGIRRYESGEVLENLVEMPSAESYVDLPLSGAPLRPVTTRTPGCNPHATPGCNPHATPGCNPHATPGCKPHAIPCA